MGFTPLFLWAIATFSLGGVAAAYEKFHVLLIAALGIAIIFRFKRHSEEELTPYPRIRIALWVSLAMTFLILFQLVSFRSFFLSFLSPLSYRLTYAVLEPLGILANGWGYPITLSRQATFLCFTEWLGFLVLLAVLTEILSSSHLRRFYVLAIVYFSSFLALFGLIHRWSGSGKMFWFLTRGSNFFGPYVSGNHAGALFSVSAAMSIALLQREQDPRKKIRWATLFGICVTAIVFTGSRAAVLSLAVVLLLLAVKGIALGEKKQRTRPYVLSALIGVTTIAFLWDASFIHRILHTPAAMISGNEFRPRFWAYALKLFASSPLFGTGLGTFSKASPTLVGDSMFLHPEHAENDYLELLSSGGLFLFGLFVTFFFFLAKRLYIALRSSKVSTSTRAFSLGLLAFLVNAFFVFHAPLPAHHILAAILLAGVMASHRHTLHQDPRSKKALAAFSALTLIFGIFAAISFSRSDRKPSEEKTQANTSTEQKAQWLVRQDELGESLKKKPMDPNSLYELAGISAGLHEPAVAKSAYGSAKRLNPFDIGRRIAVGRAMASAGEWEAALSIFREILEGPASLDMGARSDLRLEAARVAVAADQREAALKLLNEVESVQPNNWRVPLLKAAMGEQTMSGILESWKLAQATNVPAQTWDQSLFSVLEKSAHPLPIHTLAEEMASRADLGIFLAKLSKFLPKDQLPLHVALDKGKPYPRLKANNPTTETNMHIEAVLDPLEIPETVQIRVQQAQPVLDAILLPVRLAAAPDTLSVRMEVSSLRPIEKQLIIEAEGKLFLTPDTADRTDRGTWLLTFRNVGKTVPKKPNGEAPLITGIGFTPLEKDGRYGIGPIEVFVDSAR